MHQTGEPTHTSALLESLGGAVTEEELAAALAAEQDALLAKQLQEQEEHDHLQFRLEQERADLAYAASFADTWERQRTRYLEEYTGSKVRTMGYHEHALNADHEDEEEEEDTREPNFDQECDYKGGKRYNPQHNVRVAGRLEKKKQKQTALKFTPPQPGGDQIQVRKVS